MTVTLVGKTQSNQLEVRYTFILKDSNLKDAIATIQDLYSTVELFSVFVSDGDNDYDNIPF